MKRIFIAFSLFIALSSCALCSGQGADFIRGDCNQDGTTEFMIGDAIALVEWLFSGGSCGIECLSACDVTDDGVLSIVDAVTMLNLGSACSPPYLPPPWPSCGPDPTPDNLSCMNYSACTAAPLPINPALVLSASTVSGSPGSTVMVDIAITVPVGAGPPQAWTYGLCHDSTSLSLVAVNSTFVATYEINTLLSDGFFSEIGIQGSAGLTPGTHVIAEAEYQVLPTATNSNLNFCTTINGCTRPLGIYAPFGTTIPCSQKPTTSSGSFNVSEPCLEILEVPILECEGGGPLRLLTVNFVNLSGLPVHKVVIPGEITTSSGTATVLDNVFNLIPEVQDGDSGTFFVRIDQVAAGDSIDVPFALLHKTDSGEVIECCSSVATALAPPCSEEFIRGDVNGDGGVDIADAVNTLGYLFTGDLISCEVAADSNDDSAVNVADAIYLLGYLFSGTANPPAPHPNCGADPTPDSLGCSNPGSC